MPTENSYWYAPILARPVPEAPDRVTVAVVFGNGRVEHVALDDGLERLRGVVSQDHRRLLEQDLQDIAEHAHRFASLDALRYELGVQFEIGTQRAMLQGLSSASVRAVKRSLFTPLQSVRERDGGLLSESLQVLDEEMHSLVTPAVHYHRKRINLTELYPSVAKRYDMGAIGPLRRVAIGDGRHLVLSSVIVRETDKSHLDSIVQRTLRQAYFLEKLREEIRTRAGIEYRFVGVIQPLEASATSETRDIREFCEQQWRSVLDNVLTPSTTGQAVELLEPQVKWVERR